MTKHIEIPIPKELQVIRACDRLLMRLEDLVDAYNVLCELLKDDDSAKRELEPIGIALAKLGNEISYFVKKRFNKLKEVDS